MSDCPGPSPSRAVPVFPQQRSPIVLSAHNWTRPSQLAKVWSYCDPLLELRFGFDTSGGDMESSSPFRVSADFLAFLN